MRVVTSYRPPSFLYIHPLKDLSVKHALHGHFTLILLHFAQFLAHALQVGFERRIVVERKAVLHGKVGIGKSIPRSGSIK